ncbi:MAG TPA: FG-GAP repeat protein, partial [Polyangiaceae bacterium]
MRDSGCSIRVRRAWAALMRLRGLSAIAAIALALFACEKNEPKSGDESIAKVRAALDSFAAVKVKAADSALNALFGQAVSASGNLALIGAPGDPISTSVLTVGAVYVLDLPAIAGATPSVKLRAAPGDAAATDRFGSSASLDGQRAFIGA